MPSGGDGLRIGPQLTVNPRGDESDPDKPEELRGVNDELGALGPEFGVLPLDVNGLTAYIQIRVL